MKKRLVGSHVIFNLAGRTRHATIIEDRGTIGIQGRRLVRLKTDNNLEMEMPLELLQFPT